MGKSSDKRQNSRCNYTSNKFVKYKIIRCFKTYDKKYIYVIFLYQNSVLQQKYFCISEK